MPDLQTDKQPESELPESPEEPKQDELEPEEQALAEPKEEPEAPEEPENPEEPKTEPTQEGQPQMSRRQAKRLEKLEGLVERLKGPQTPAQRRADAIDYSKMIEAEPEVYDQLNKASQEFGNQQYEAGLQQVNSIQFHTRLEIDAPRIESKYPQFDPTSEEFNPGVADAINKWYLATVGYDSKTNTVQNPDVRYASFVEGIMELADAMASSKTTRATQNIARQAANAGLRPDGSSVKSMNLNKAPQDMTAEELNAAISATMPRDSRGRFTK